MPTVTDGHLLPEVMPNLAVGSYEDYSVDWTAVVTANSTTMTASAWDVPAGLTLDADTFTSAGSAVARVVAVIPGTYRITHTAELANNKIKKTSMSVHVYEP